MMTYLVRGRNHNYDIENILNLFGLEKTKESADMALSVDEEVLSLDGSGVEFSTPLFYADGTPKEKDELKRALYRYLCGMFGEPSGWGILVGVRPVKLASQMLIDGMKPEDVSAALVGNYLLAPEYADLLVEIAKYENEAAPPRRDFSLGSPLERPEQPSAEDSRAEDSRADFPRSDTPGHPEISRAENLTRFEDRHRNIAAASKGAHFESEVSAPSGEGRRYSTAGITEYSGKSVCGNPKSRRNASLYLSVPFCPTRCKYCSFPMQPLATKRKLLPLYFEKFRVELEETLKMLVYEGVDIDCIYFGGGTPSTLEPEMIEEIGAILETYMDFSELKEFTFEAGRSDTVDEKLIDTLVKIGVGRVSVNPQSFTEAALAESHRRRPEGEFERAFALARDAGLKINSDLILGLAGEDERQYLEGLRYLVGLRPENITVHALSLKRGSPLFGEKIQDERLRQIRDLQCSSMQATESPTSVGESVLQTFELFMDRKRDSSAYGPDKDVERKKQLLSEYLQSQRRRYLSMSRGGAEILKEAGYFPYYLYRQKRILANMENIGYSLVGEGCLYNSRIMSERYDIFAVGTGGVTKICYPIENRHEQIAGTRSVEDYIEHFSKVLERVEIVRRLIRSEISSIRSESPVCS